MAEVILTNGKYDTLSGKVETFNWDIPSNLNNELIKYYANNKPVCLRMDNKFFEIGHVVYVNNLDVVVEIHRNKKYSDFLRHMLYRAIDYKIIAQGLGQVQGSSISKFKVSRLVITNYVKWF